MAVGLVEPAPSLPSAPSTGPDLTSGSALTPSQQQQQQQQAATVGHARVLLCTREGAAAGDGRGCDCVADAGMQALEGAQVCCLCSL